MLYQVMYKEPSGSCWLAYMTPCTMMNLSFTKHACMRAHPGAEVTYITGYGQVELDAQRQRLENQGPMNHVEGSLDAERWNLEDGPGGDHDQPYHFEQPTGAFLSGLVHLLAKVVRGELVP